MIRRHPKLSLILLLVFVALLFFSSRQASPAAQPIAPSQELTLVTAAPTDAPAGEALDEGGSYTTAEDLALYLQRYGHLPPNFVGKDQARAAGWDGGALEPILPGKCIGGDSFGNREGLLPDAPGRIWRECDVNTLGQRSRGPERLVYSNDGLIYYTADHYESFTLLSGTP